ncbi:MAG: FAD-dependent oxidoreductase, partial [Verrucomicrobiaceae bacterium]|nr:FAD-dependent oxidoreductase [Verrucomicrobiaceae bacterium]
RTFLLETFQGRRAKSEHLDGRFYYPRLGIGMIAEKLAASCGADRVRLNARVTGLRHDGRRVNAVEVNGSEVIPADRVICTLPLPLTAKLLSPALPAPVLEEIAALRFRHVVLVGLFLRRASATHVGSVYFPDAGFPMTRVYEPRNRSAEMAPPGHTMLVAEIPCDAADAVWQQPDDEIVRVVADKLGACGWFRADEITGGCVKRLPAAYPVLAAGVQKRVRRVMDALSVFDNLSILGRNGEFRYTHLHDLLRFGHDVISALPATRGVS